MSDIIRVVSIELLKPKQGHASFYPYEVRAWVEDVVMTLPARLYPTDLAHPAEFGPAECIGEFEVHKDDDHPPLNVPDNELIDYLDQRVDVWTPIEVSDF